MRRGVENRDIVIAGGGPAGAVAAIMLARAGYRVALATLSPKVTRVEGLSPRIAAVLRAQGLPLEGVAPPSQRRVNWGDFQGDQNVEQIVLRDRFDLGLLDCARETGVEIIEGAIASVEAAQKRIQMRDGAILTAKLLFDARGRRAPQASGGQHDTRIGPASVSIAGFVPEHNNALGSQVQALPNGWVWRAALQDGRVWQQIVTDAEAVGAAANAKARIKALWEHVLGYDSPLPQTPVVHHCALRLNAAELDPNCPRLGDAAVALDPLSGHGMFWAISSALMAVPIARAIFAGRADLAADFYRDRVIDTFWRQARVGRDFHLACGREDRFWSKRAKWPDQQPSHPPVAQPYLEPRVLCQEGTLSRAEVLVTEQDPGGAGFVGGIEIAPILRRIGPRALPNLNEFQQHIVPDLAPLQARGLHAWLTQRGLANSPALQSRSKEENDLCEPKPAA